MHNLILADDSFAQGKYIPEGAIIVNRPPTRFEQWDRAKSCWVLDESAKNAAQAEYDAKAYARSRAAEYPSIADQLDDIYHNGIDAWKATIKTTKDKYPKP
jgi:hypothetical protein